MQIEEITTIIQRPVGSVITYHVGHIAVDRAKHRIDGPGIVERTAAEREAVNDTAIIAMRLADQGMVALTQRRLGTHSYQYLATRI